MTEPRHVAIRVDGGGALGVGHAMRCATLAAALRRAGHEVTVVTRAMPDWVRPRFVDVGCSVEPIDAPLRSGGDVAADVWVVDGYTLGDELLALLGSDTSVVVIDDNHELPVAGAALVVNQNLHATPALYPDVDPDRLRLGAAYAMVRPDVLTLPDRPAPATDARSVLLAFGGTDPAGLTLPVARRLAGDGLDVIVAMSPDHPDRTAVARIAGTRFDRGDLVDGLTGADVAVIGGGSTLWEVATVGLPGVAVVVADNQVAGTAAAVDAGFVTSVDVRDGESTAHDVADRALGLLADVDRRSAMAQAGRRHFDGAGATRVAEAVAGVV